MRPPGDAGNVGIVEKIGPPCSMFGHYGVTVRWLTEPALREKHDDLDLEPFPVVDLLAAIGAGSLDPR